jgi:hypothetical protein
MPVTPQERFAAAVTRGMRASPFASTVATPLTYISGTGGRVDLAGCLVLTGDNKAKSEEFGIDHVSTIKVQILKSLVALKPRITLDALEYAGLRYSLTSVSGDAEYSPVWVVEGSSPLKS